MAVAKDQSAFDSEISSPRTDFTATLASAVAAGDLAFWLGVFDINNEARTLAAPAGFTEIFNANFGDSSGFFFRGILAYKVCTGAEGTAFVGTSSVATFGLGGIVTYKGAHATAPINASDDQQQDNLSAPASPTVTTTADGCHILSVLLGSSGMDSTGTPPSGMASEFAQDAGGDSLNIAGKDQASAGATGAQTWAKDTNACRAIAVAIAPAAGGGGRIMSSMAGPGGLAGPGGIAGPGGGLAG